MRVIQKAFFAENNEPEAPQVHHGEFPPISFPERLGAVLLLATALLIGLYPRLLLDLIVPTLTQSPLFDGLKKSCSL